MQASPGEREPAEAAPGGQGPGGQGPGGQGPGGRDPGGRDPGSQGTGDRGKRRFRERRPRPTGWHRWTRLGLEVLLGIVAGAVILAGFVAWRLSEGPVPLSFLTPRLEAALAQSEGAVAIEETFLVWDSERASLDLRVHGLSLRDAEGRQGLYLPQSNLSFSIRDLFLGRLVVSGLEILGAEVSLLRLEDGSFTWHTLGSADPGSDDRAGEGGSAAAPGDGAAPEAVEPTSLALVQALLADEDEAGVLGQLREIRLRDTLVTLEDRQQGLFWTLPAEVIVLARDERGLVGEASLALQLEDESTAVQLVFAYGKGRGLIDLSAEVEGLAVTKLALLIPAMAELDRLQVRASGSLNATIAPESDLALIDFDLALGPGSLRFDEVGRPPLSLRGGRLAGLYDGGAEKLAIDRLELASGSATEPGPIIGLAGTFQPAPAGSGGMQLALAFDLDRIDVWDLVALWPPSLSPGGLAWVREHFLEGRVENLTGSLTLLLPEETNGEAASDDVRLQAIEGRFDLAGAAVDYYPPLPAVSDIAAEASFDNEVLRFRTSPTALGEVRLEPVTIEIYDFQTEIQQMTIQGSGSGALPIVLGMIDQPPLDLVKPLGIDPAKTEGQASFDLTLNFPLLDVLSLGDFGYAAAATLNAVRLRELIAGNDLTADSLSLSLDREALEIAGTVEIAGSRLALNWREADGGTTLSAETEALDAATATALVPALAGRLDGTLAGTFRLVGRPAGEASIEADFDLANAVLDLPDLAWRKPAGAAGRVRFGAELDDGNLLALRDLLLEAPGLLVQGRMDFSPSGDLTQAAFSRLETEVQALSDVVARPLVVEGESGWDLSLGGGILDLRPWLERLELGEEGRGGAPLRISAGSLERVLFPGGWIDGAALGLERGPQGLTHLSLEGSLRDDRGPGGPLRIALAPNAAGNRALVIESGDMGRLLAVLGIAEGVVGGALTIQASASQPGADAPLAGTVEGTGFRLVDAPVLAQILLVASLTGIGDVLAGDGITFERVTGDIAFSGGVLSTDLMRAYGGSLGLTVQGEVDFGADVIDLEGSIVPAYAINQVLGEIPLVGWILTGGEGGGLLAVSYSVSGPVADPQVSVNPLSALTPGFLRGLFDLFEDDGSAPPLTLYPEGPTR